MAEPADVLAVRFLPVWLNTADADVVDRLKVFTFLSRERIEELERETQENPRARAAQKALAHEVTTWVHGEQETARVEAATAALWGGDADSLRNIDAFTLLAPPLIYPRHSWR